MAVKELKAFGIAMGIVVLLAALVLLGGFIKVSGEPTRQDVLDWWQGGNLNETAAFLWRNRSAFAPAEAYRDWDRVYQWNLETFGEEYISEDASVLEALAAYEPFEYVAFKKDERGQRLVFAFDVQYRRVYDQTIWIYYSEDERYTPDLDELAAGWYVSEGEPVPGPWAGVLPGIV